MRSAERADVSVPSLSPSRQPKRWAAGAPSPARRVVHSALRDCRHPAAHGHLQQPSPGGAHRSDIPQRQPRQRASRRARCTGSRDPGAGRQNLCRAAQTLPSTGVNSRAATPTVRGTTVQRGTRRTLICPFRGQTGNGASAARRCAYQAWMRTDRCTEPLHRKRPTGRFTRRALESNRRSAWSTRHPRKSAPRHCRRLRARISRPGSCPVRYRRP